jgi:hypothetical protein
MTTLDAGPAPSEARLRADIDEVRRIVLQGLARLGGYLDMMEAWLTAIERRATPRQ